MLLKQILTYSSIKTLPMSFLLFSNYTLLPVMADKANSPAEGI